MKLPIEWRGLPVGHVVVRLLLIAFVVSFFVASLVAGVRAGVVGWALNLGNGWWRAAREWLTPW